MVIRNQELAAFQLLYAGGDTRTNKLSAVFGHVCSNVLGYLLVESTKQDRAHHHCGIEAQSRQEASAFKCDVGGTNDQARRNKK